MLAGCVSLDGDATGDRWALGLVRQSVSPPDSGGNRMVATTTIGLATGGAEGAGVTVGYNKSVLLKLGKDACVDIKRAGPCRQLAATLPKKGAIP
jgi:hypothetical protein